VSTPTATATLASTTTLTPTPPVTATSTPVPTDVPTDVPTPEPTVTAALPLHDSVVFPLKPRTYIIATGTTSIRDTIRVRVLNADIPPTTEVGGHTIRLDVASSDCPAGLAGTPDFGSRATGPSNVISVAAGKRRTARVPLTIESGAFASFNRKAPARCTLTLTATVDGSLDPTPDNAVATIEVNVFDANIPEGTDRHESLVNSVAPVKIKLHGDTPTTAKRVKAIVVNADILPAPDTVADAITVTAGDGDCPSGTVGVVDFDNAAAGAQNTALVNGGQARSGVLALAIDSAGFLSPNAKSPARCSATLTATGPGGDTEGGNNVTGLVIDVFDQGDF
jgi:hypothetical protein